MRRFTWECSSRSHAAALGFPDDKSSWLRQKGMSSSFVPPQGRLQIVQLPSILSEVLCQICQLSLCRDFLTSRLSQMINSRPTVKSLSDEELQSIIEMAKDIVLEFHESVSVDSSSSLQNSIALSKEVI